MIPTLNEAAHIGALLKRLEGQNFAGPYEVIVSDGGSTDATCEIVRQFSAVRLLQGASGVSRQRNVGAHAANGGLLIFLDADDLPSFDFLRYVAASYQKLPFAIACPWFVAHDSGFLVRAIYFLFNLSFFFSQSTVRMGSGVCLICPREKFLKVGGFDETMHLGEDIRLIRALCPRFGLHRHLFVPLETSGRRFSHEGSWKLGLFYLKITPFLLLGSWKPLQKFAYKAAPYVKK